MNKIFAVKRRGEWWAVIDCGEAKEGGMTVGNYWQTHFKRSGRAYRWYDKIFQPPSDLKEWHEIHVITKQVTVVDEVGHEFEGWEDANDLCYKTLQNFCDRIGRPMSIEVIKKLINEPGDKRSLGKPVSQRVYTDYKFGKDDTLLDAWYFEAALVEEKKTGHAILGFSNYDGSGYWVKDGKKSRDEIFSTPRLDATHIVWYNK
jgi:hypothetical protein